MRICSLLPSATEIAFALGLGESVVGVSHECDFPDEARRKPVIVRGRIASPASPSGEIDRQVREQLNAASSLYTLDREQLQHLAPDLILTQELCRICAVDYREVEQVCQAMDPRPEILSLAPTSLDGVFDDIARVAECTNSAGRAQMLIASLEARIDDLQRKTSGLDFRPRVACLEWLDPIFSAGHWIPQMVALAGGEDVLARPGEPSAQLSWNHVVERAPEVLILMPCGFDVQRTLSEIALVKERPGWNELPAVSAGRVFAVCANALFSRPGPRLIDGLELLAGLLHPRLFPHAVEPAMACNILRDD